MAPATREDPLSPNMLRRSNSPSVKASNFSLPSMSILEMEDEAEALPSRILDSSTLDIERVAINRQARQKLVRAENRKFLFVLDWTILSSIEFALINNNLTVQKLEIFKKCPYHKWT